MNTLSRREVMTSAAAAAAAAAVAAAVAAPATALAAKAGTAVHPDAELIALVDDLITLGNWLSTEPLSRREEDANWGRYFDIEERVLSLEPQTVSGVAAKLRVIWRLYHDDRTEHYHGAQRTSDPHTKAFWATIQAAEAMGRAAEGEGRFGPFSPREHV